MKLLVAGAVGQVTTGAGVVPLCATLRWRKPSAPIISEPAGLAEELLLLAGTVVSFTFGDMFLELLLLLLLPLLDELVPLAKLGSFWNRLFFGVNTRCTV